jgi:uncharacterized protein (TIGR02246 family)
MKLSLALVASAALLFASCAPQAPAGLSEADGAANDAVVKNFVERVLAKDWEGVAALYTEDAVLLPPNAPAVKGRAAIKSFFETFFSSVTAIEATATQIEGRGDLAYGTGTYTLTLEIEGMGTLEDKGKFLEVRRKGADGQWRYTYDMFSSDLPPPAPPAAPMEESGS